MSDEDGVWKTREDAAAFEAFTAAMREYGHDDNKIDQVVQFARGTYEDGVSYYCWVNSVRPIPWYTRLRWRLSLWLAHVRVKLGVWL